MRPLLAAKRRESAAQGEGLGLQVETGRAPKAAKEQNVLKDQFILRLNTCTV